MPVRAEGHASVAAVYPTNVLTLLALLLAVLAVLRRSGDRGRLYRGVTLAAGTVLLGAALYWPWPKFDTFYGLPFFAAPALLYGAAIDRLWCGSHRERIFAVLVAVVAPLYGAIPASRSTESAAASLQLNADFAHLLTRFQPGDTIAVLDPASGPRQLLAAPELLRTYAAAIKLFPDTADAPTIISVGCDSLQQRVATPGMVVSYSYGCGRFRQPQLRIVAPFVWRDWLTLAAVRDTLSVEFVGPLVNSRLLHRAGP